MPIHNLLRSGTFATIQRGDLVFQITNPDRGTARRAGHAGIVAQGKANHSLGEEVLVFHMGERIEKHRWTNGSERDHPDQNSPVPKIDNRADIVGSVSFLEEADRRAIVQCASELCQRAPSKMRGADDCCYWIGEPNADIHPLQPKAEGAYAFSCTTFAHYCYAKVDVLLVALDEVPFLTPRDREMFERWGYGSFVAPDPVRRLSCGHLICAFEAEPEAFPWRPHNGDWAPHADAPTFERLINAAGLL